MLLLVAVLLGALGGTGALAADLGASSWGRGKCLIKVANAKDEDPTHGSVGVSTTDTINFRADGVFTGTSTMESVYILEIFSTDIKNDTAAIISAASGSGWKYQETSWWIRINGYNKAKSYIYQSNQPITQGTFDSLMAAITVKMNPKSSAKSASGKVNLVAYSSAWGILSSGTVIANPYSTYVCELSFNNYATAEVDQGSVKMDYKSDNAEGYDDTYESYAQEGKAGNVKMEPADKNGGRCEFDVNVTDMGSAEQFSIGYQYIKSGQNWSGAGVIKYVDGYKNKKVKDWKKQPIHVTVDGLEAGVDYQIRGVIITDGKTNSPRYTEEVSFRYDKPGINSFSTGGTTTVYQGGRSTMNVSMYTSFNDRNASGQTYTGVNGQEYNGPVLQADVYFTDHAVFENGYDKSVWYKVNAGNLNSVHQNMSELTSWSKTWTNVEMPKSLASYAINTGDDTLTNKDINSTTCAYKLVITDQYTGYSTVEYSDFITIDSGKPDAPTMQAVVAGETVTSKVDKNNPDNKETNALQPVNATVTGGTSESGSAGVEISIGGADDHGGSGVKQYTYSMYYVATEKVPAKYTTTEDVLNLLKSYESNSYDSFCEYKDWTVLADKEGVDNWSQLFITKDGYYRIVARAEDNAGFISDDVVEGYFRVDLTPPSTPNVYLAQRDAAGNFVAYNNSSYTTAEVWAFAYSTPKTGKDIKSFKFSTDSGLTWTDTKDLQATNAEGTPIKKENKAANGALNTVGKVPHYSDGTYTVTISSDYQIAVNLTALGYSDYVPVMFKVVDSMGNESAVSNEIAMRTVANVTTAAALSHDPIEVAMSLGNTALEMEQNIKPIKMYSARMINEKYYGTTGSTSFNAADFNPYLYTKGHDCTYATDSATGSCTQGNNCPYNIVETAGYNIYKPEWINISGLSGSDTAKKISDWAQYDHNTNSRISVPISINGRVRGYSDTHATGNGNDGQDTGSCMLRERHIIDMSSAKDWSHILFAGVSREANSDWLFYHFNQNTNKQILFTMNTAQCHFHTYQQSGFWFNTTIRQNKSKTWVVSGYRVMITQGGGSWRLTDKTGSSTNCALVVQKFTDYPVESLADYGGTQSGTTIATASLSGSGASLQNFMIDLTGSTCSIYKIEGSVSSSNMTPKYFRERAVKVLDSVSTPRPTVDGYTIGDIETPNNPYANDTDCYGFGPIVGYSGHSCSIETRVEFSNIALYYNTGKTLSEVVTEPSWGEGKARYILNLTDDVSKDFDDPVLSAQIQWRLNNDKARYIGWGRNTLGQKAKTDTFLARLAGTTTEKDLRLYGMYEARLESETAARGSDRELTDVAKYITEQYYRALGYDTTLGVLVKDQASPEDGVAAGTAYTLDNISNIHLDVKPASLAESSANPDFPAGRWYMVHEPLSPNGTIDARSGKFSDALETGITLPGHYTYYFAPSQDDIDNNTLNSHKAIFDFVVHEKPKAQFTATIKTRADGSGEKYLDIDDFSVDPDSPNGKLYAGDMLNSGINLTGDTPVTVADNVQIGGIIKTEWRYQFLTQEGGTIKVAKETNWSTTSPHNSNLRDLTGYDNLPTNSVLTIYMRVTDVTGRKMPVLDSTGAVTGYTYEAVEGSVSDVAQGNATEGASVTYPPSSSINMTPTVIYDTAKDDQTNRGTVTIERLSSHPQNGKNFKPSWAINLTEVGVEGNKDKAGYIDLTQKNGNDYYYGNTLVLKCVTPPTTSGNIGDGTNGSTGGKWQVSYSTISSLLQNKTGTHIKLQLTETTYGMSTGSTSNAYITDQSARSILFDKDQSAPSAQIVTTATKIVENGVAREVEYAASNYLDVTNNDKFVVVNFSGAKDEQGVLKGYGYYFYDKDSSGREIAWYKLDTATNTWTTCSSAAQALTRVVAASGKIEIGKSYMRKTPTDSLNVAIFAYDNQTDMATESGGNQSAKTKITNIKLTVSEPMPPSITATDMMNKVVATVGNDYGYKHVDATTGSEYYGNAEGVAGNDAQTSDLEFFSATDVTVEFKLKKDKYVKQEDGSYIKDASGTEFYQDVYAAADLTGTPSVTYEVKYKKQATQADWCTDKELKELGITKNDSVSEAKKLTFTTDGVYEVTARVTNGSKIQSEGRTVKFTIDKQAPSNMQVTFTHNNGQPYTGNIWTKQVSITASGATDTNADSAKYQYSYDGGKTWIDLGGLNLGSVSLNFTESGKHSVKVRAIDKAGNSTEYGPVVVCVDNQPPIMKLPEVTSSSTMTDLLNEYVLSLSYDSTKGAVHSVVNGVESELDREVAVATGESVMFRLYPNDGYIVSHIYYKGEELVEKIDTDELGVDYIEIKNVKSDENVSVEFTQSELSRAVYTNLTRGIVAMQFAAEGVRAASAGEEPDVPVGGGAADPDEGEQADNEGEDNDPDAGVNAMYNILCSGDTYIKILSASPDSGLINTSTTITVEAYAGYRIATFTVSGEDKMSELIPVANSNAYTYTFTPSAEKTYFVQATTAAVPKRNVTLVNNNADCGTVSLLDNTGGELTAENGVYSIAEGSTVKLYTNANTGYAATLTIDGTAVEDFKNMSGESYYQYTIPEFTGEGDAPGIQLAVSFDVTGESYQWNLSVDESGNGKINNSVAETTVSVPAAGARSVIITADAGYRLDKLLSTRQISEEETTTTDVIADVVKISDSPREYRYTINGSLGTGSLKAVFTQQTYKVATVDVIGGYVNVSRADDPNAGLTLDVVPEGTALVIKPISKSGYRIQSLTITEKYGEEILRTYSAGAVSSYNVNSLATDLEIEARFVEREVERTETTHSISIKASGIKDADDALAKAPYSFCIADAPEGTVGRNVSEWSAWSNINEITYTGGFTPKDDEDEWIEFKPNTVYYAYLRATDNVGNVSTPVVATVYTRANTPGAVEAVTIDDANESSTKSVALTVNPNGNPGNTQYLVRVSQSDNMSGSFVANADDENGGWSELAVGNKFIIKGLSPGLWYHMQVMAKNADGAETTSSREIVSIMLSPAAPPENSFYFDEQTSPTSGITLTWNTPDADVKGVQIYRDGMLIAQYDTESDTQFHIDPRSNISADSITQYSYAYINSAGVGSSRMAVSREYYGTANDVTDEGKAKFAQMQEWLKLNPYMFSETMTYPCYQYGSKDISASMNGMTENSGTITVQMAYNATDSARYQKYFLYLKAYETDEAGEPTDTEVPYSAWGNYYTTVDGIEVPKTVETKVTQLRGQTAARATWDNLSTKYVYKVFVDEIRSTGKSTTGDIGGQSEEGIEYTLGKTFVVNRNGYYTMYTDPTAAKYLEVAPPTPWKTADGEELLIDEITQYTNNAETGWDTPVNAGYIKFNQSPYIQLAKNKYGNNEAEKIQGSGEDQYLLIDRSMEDQTFSINVAAWDKDGSRTGANLPKPAVGATISGITGSADAINEMPKTEENAEAAPYPITFDAGGLPTGIYTKMDMWASDSDTKTDESTEAIKLVVNNNSPVITVSGSTTMKIENGKTYTKTELSNVTAKAAEDRYASESLSKVALMLMPEQYTATFGTADYNTLYSYLVTGTNSNAVTNAKALLGTAVGNTEYVTGNKLTEKGMYLAVARVATPINRYVITDEATYNAVVATNPDKVIKDEGVSGNNIYWLELGYALDNNKCEWLKKNGENVKVSVDELGATDKSNTYEMKVVSNFGNNTVAQTVDFIVKAAPFAIIQSDKEFVWQDTSQEEYEHYKNPTSAEPGEEKPYTVRDILDRYSDCYDPNNIEGIEANTTIPAYRYNEETNTYYVYKLVDKIGEVGSDFINGTMNINLGVHDQFSELGVLLVANNGTFNPNTATTADWTNVTTVKSPAYANQGSGGSLKPVTSSGDKPFSVSGLTPDVTYYLWSYYKLADSDEIVYSQSYVALTTLGNFKTAYYGFTTDKYSLTEKPGDNSANEREYEFPISKRGSGDASATVGITINYYMADEFGNLELDENGNLKHITGEKLENAKKVLGFVDGSGATTQSITFGDANSKSVYLKLKDDKTEQGHMVARLTLSIESNDAGYCYISNGGSYTDIFVQDDESPITNFKLGIINTDKNGNQLMTEIYNSKNEIDHYEYQMDGLQVDYSTLSTLLLKYVNAGTGKLNNIKATVYDDKDGTVESKYFQTNNLKEGSLDATHGIVGEVTIQPEAGLPDGVYEGWLFLTADHAGNIVDTDTGIREGEPVKIKLRQVVGQSTLKGRIYITPEEPSDSTRTGVAKVSLYDADTTSFDSTTGTFSTEPLYTTLTDEYGGYFEIPNILNKSATNTARYFIVVERDGFLTYNSVRYAVRDSQGSRMYSLNMSENSATYTFNLRLIGGDIDHDNTVNNTDLSALILRYNEYWKTDEEMVGATQADINENAIIKRCDFNGDGVVNALDRAFLVGNTGQTGAKYDYKGYSNINPD